MFEDSPCLINRTRNLGEPRFEVPIVGEIEDASPVAVVVVENCLEVDVGRFIEDDERNAEERNTNPKVVRSGADKRIARAFLWRRMSSSKLYLGESIDR